MAFNVLGINNRVISYLSPNRRIIGINAFRRIIPSERETLYYALCMIEKQLPDSWRVVESPLTDTEAICDLNIMNPELVLLLLASIARARAAAITINGNVPWPWKSDEFSSKATEIISSLEVRNSQL